MVLLQSAKSLGMRFLRSEEGQGASELMLVISVVTLGVVGAGYTFIPIFRAGVTDLAASVGGTLNGQAGGSMVNTTGGPTISIPADGTFQNISFETVMGAGVAALAVVIGAVAWSMERGAKLTQQQETQVRGWMADFAERGGTMQQLNQAKAAVANSGGDLQRAYDIVSGRQPIQNAVYHPTDTPKGPTSYEV